MGLGNPGPGYAHTRHNAGFWFVDRVSGSGVSSLRYEAKFSGQVGRVSVGGAPCWLLKPDTFMNRSGESVASFANYYQIPHDAILVAHDELDLPLGTARLKLGGGHGGHNGLRDLIERLGDGEFLRLRLGVGHPGARELVMPYLLSRPLESERSAIEGAIGAATEVLPLVLAGDLPKAMNRLHRREPVGAAAPGTGDGL